MPSRILVRRNERDHGVCFRHDVGGWRIQIFSYSLLDVEFDAVRDDALDVTLTSRSGRASSSAHAASSTAITKWLSVLMA